ncbi:MAG TPA: SRPBCC domain-containing protein [Chryseosolibacter sp.]
MKPRYLTLIVTLINLTSSHFASAQPLTAAEQEMLKEKKVSLYIRINASVDSVWSRWASEKGIKMFFAPACTYELKTFGKLDILFAPLAPPGQRGAEDNRILAVEEKKMISFTWDAPPQYPEIRKQRTLVTVRFYPTSSKETLVTLTQTGWGQGEDWNTVLNYFKGAWAGFVLPNLKYSLEVAPINWTDFPNHAPKGLKPAEAF